MSSTRWITLVAAGCLSTLSIADDVPSAPVFKSTLLGFSFEYPAGWIKQQVGVCGNEAFDMTPEQRVRELAPVIEILSEKMTASAWPSGSIHVGLRRVLDDPPDAHFRKTAEEGTKPWEKDGPEVVRDSMPIRTASGIPGIKIRTRTSAKAGAVGLGVVYSLVFGGRELELACRDRSRPVEVAEAEFDRVAKSVQFFDPVSDSPAPGAYKVFRLRGASFEYPGEWVWKPRNNDDESALRQVTLSSPDGPTERLMISLYFSEKSLQEFETEARTNFAKTDNIREFEVVPFRNPGGATGLTMFARTEVYVRGGGKGIARNRWRVLPMSNGQLAILFIIGVEVTPDPWQAVIERAERSFAVE